MSDVVVVTVQVRVESEDLAHELRAAPVEDALAILGRWVNEAGGGWNVMDMGWDYEFVSAAPEGD